MLESANEGCKTNCFISFSSVHLPWQAGTKSIQFQYRLMYQISSCGFFTCRCHRLAVPAPVQRQRRHPVLQQHGGVRAVDGGVAVLPADGGLPRDPGHRLERGQQRPRKGARREKRISFRFRSKISSIHWEFILMHLDYIYTISFLLHKVVGNRGSIFV